MEAMIEFLIDSTMPDVPRDVEGELHFIARVLAAAALLRHADAEESRTDWEALVELGQTLRKLEPVLLGEAPDQDDELERLEDELDELVDANEVLRSDLEKAQAIFAEIHQDLAALERSIRNNRTSSLPDVWGAQVNNLMGKVARAGGFVENPPPWKPENVPSWTLMDLDS